MNNKTLSIVSYITLIGWLVACFLGKNNSDSLLRYHLRQSLGLFTTAFIFNALLRVLVSVVPQLGFISYVGFVFLLLMVVGIINAANGVQKPLPIIGSIFESKFSFIG